MPPLLALLLCLGFIAWLFYRERRERVSSAMWIPSVWLFILASRPISVWFGFAPPSDSDPLEGSEFDRIFFLTLIMAGSTVLLRRHLNWTVVFRNNRWLFVFFLYLCLSSLWSDYPIISFKRWIKDLGNVIMVLIVLTDMQPIRATKVLLARCCYLLIPLSVLLIAHFPELGQYYDRWDRMPFYQGVTLNKNLFGMTLFACGVALIWMLFELIEKKGTGARARLDYFIILFLGSMVFWLLQKANSSTGLACSILGGLILFGMRFALVRKNLRWFWAYGVAGTLVLLYWNVVFGPSDVFARLLGRDTTLTGRTDIWNLVLSEGVNPLFGTGFYSFWSGERLARISATYSIELNEAHNGYLETYLNSGWIGVLLLLAVILSAGSRIKLQAMQGKRFAAFRVACFLAVLPYGVTEAIFNRMNPVWFLFLLATVEYPRDTYAHYTNMFTSTRYGLKHLPKRCTRFISSRKRVCSSPC
jgi:O-antigen ligase